MVILTTSSSASSLSQFFTVILIFAFVVFITYLTTKYTGKFQKIQGYNRNFEVIETFRLANNKYLQLVRAADKYLVIAIGKDEVTMIAELNEENIIKAPGSSNETSEAFASLISKAKERMNKGGNNE